MIEQEAQYLETVVDARTRLLQNVASRLAHLDETKSDFIDMAAHELRTPLTILRGYSDCLIEDETIRESPHLSRIIQAINTGSQELGYVITNMIDVAMLDNQTVEIY